jgi:uncharacterized membrane-anchored protein
MSQTLSAVDLTITARRPSKVPVITAWFWIAKLLTTAMGEAASDSLVHRLDPVLAVAIGASFADWFGKPHHKGGLGFGTIPVAVALTILILAVVGYLTMTREDVERRAA